MTRLASSTFSISLSIHTGREYPVSLSAEQAERGYNAMDEKKGAVVVQTLFRVDCNRYMGF